MVKERPLIHPVTHGVALPRVLSSNLFQSEFLLCSEVVFKSPSLTAYYDSELCCLRYVMHASPRPCFTEELLNDIRTLNGKIMAGEWKVDFFVQSSGIPGIFSLGGDLSLFRHCALLQDWDRLREYALLCIEILNDMVQGFDRKIICIALVQGDALGGGFECALATDFLIAESDTKLGFPEVLFNLFPGMGAYSLLARRIGPTPAQRVILGGALHSATDLHAQGVLDRLAVPGQGLQVVEQFIRETRKRLHGFKAFLAARHRASFWCRKDELTDIVLEWVESVRHLGERDLKLMDRLVSAQNRRQDGCPRHPERIK